MCPLNFLMTLLTLCKILILPRVLYHPEEEMYHYWGEANSRLQKREVLTAVTIVTLLGLGAAGTAME